MMKRKFLAVFLPIIGTVAVVGSGFSAWYFGEGGATKGSSTNEPFDIYITESVVNKAGKLEVATNADAGGAFNGENLWLDQAFADLENENYADSGIIFSKIETFTGVKDDITKASALYFIYNVKFTEDPDNNYKLATAYDAGMKLTITFTITLTGGLDEYIQLQTGANVAVTGDIIGTEGNSITATPGQDEDGNTTYTYTYPVSDPAENNPATTSVWNWDFTLSCKTNATTYKNDLFTWKSGQKPETKGEYDDMLLALKGTEGALVNSQVKFDITAELK